MSLLGLVLEATDKNRNYPSWSAAHTPDQTPASATHPPQFPSMDSYLPVHTSTDPPSTSTPSVSSLPGHPGALPGGLPARQPPYTSYPLSAPATSDPNRFFDNNPRPTKSPRHTGPPERLYSDIGSRFQQPTYGQSQSQSQTVPNRAPEYFPMPTWSTASDSATVYGTAGAPQHTPQPQPQVSQSYDYSSTQGGSTQGNYTWNTS